MKILITGATGTVGRSLGKRLVRDGHQIVALTRNAQRAKETLPFPAQIFSWDGLHEMAPALAFDGVHAVIHLAGDGIADARWTKARKQQLLDSRVETTKNLLAGLKESGASLKTFISASAIGIYPSSTGIQTESSAHGTGYLAELCEQWESAALHIHSFQPQARVVLLRISLVLQKAEGFLGTLEPLFFSGLGARLGDGLQGMSFVHIADLESIVTECLSNTQLTGAINACAPRPTTNAEFTEVFAQRLGRKTFLPAPKVALKALYGEMSSLLFADQKIVSEKLPGSLFKFPDIHSALEDLYSPLQAAEEQYVCEQWVPQSVEKVFPFFESEKNLEEITPEFLNFRVIGKSTEHVQAGTLIDYRLSLRGIPFQWQTKIESFEKNRGFTDMQVKGPYSKWHHRHTFEALGGGTLCRDEVTYRLPLGVLGRWSASHLVRKDIRRIFSYRRKKIAQKFF